MSGYTSVVGGKLKLKRSAGAAASSSSSSSAAPQRGAAAQMALAGSAGTGIGDRLSGAKRREPEVLEAAAGAAAAAEGGAGAGAGAGGAGGAAAAAEADANAPPPPAAYVGGKTPAQRAHDEAMRKRQKELASKQASLSHREKIVVMNEYLAKLPEHNDIPKISYTG